MKRVFALTSLQDQEISTIQRYKITALLIISLTIGIYITLFGLYRIWGGRMIVGISEITLGVFFLVAFIMLRRHIHYYQFIAKTFFIIAYILMIILTLYIPDERTHILWVPAILVLIFFLLDYKGGILFLTGYILFVLYLAIAGYSYTLTEYITWIISLVATSLVMYYYEKIKMIESSLLQEYNRTLKQEVAQKTRTLSRQNQLLQTHQKELEELNQDLEERILMELEKRVKQEQILLQQCRMGSMGEILDAIAHQWRQPLMHINATLMNLDRELEKKDYSLVYMGEKVSEVITETGHMSQMIEEFRSLFHVDKKSTTFAIHEAVEKALAIFNPAAKHISITKTLQKELLYTGYFNEIIQAILALLNNMMERLSLYAPKEKHLSIILSASKKDIILSITDNAGPMPGPSPELIFLPHTTDTQHIQSTDLGLYIAKIIVEKNSYGELIVENDHTGVTFTIRLRREDVRYT